MSYIGNSPGVSSQRVVTEEVISGSAKSAFYPVGGYALGYVDVLINGLEVDSSDFTATDGVVVTLGTAAAVGDTVKIKAYIPRGLSDGYLKSEADARYPRVDTASQGLNSTQKTNVLTNIGGQAALGYTPVNKAGDTMSGNLKLPALGVDTGNNTSTIRVSANAAQATSGVNFTLWGKDMDTWGGDIHYITDSRGAGGGHRYFKWDGTTWTQQMLLDKNNNLNLNAGNLVLASGKGIDFSATGNGAGLMTGELLNDYEEGTWTPNIGGNATYNGQVGVYTKIGRMVTVQCDMWINVRGTGSAIQVYGMPFAAAPGNYYTANVAYFANLTGTVFWIQGIVPIHPTPQVYFETITSTSGQYTANDASAIFQNTSRIIFTATYFTA